MNTTASTLTNMQDITPNPHRDNNPTVDLIAMIRQIIGLLAVIATLIVIIKLQRGFELADLISDPTLLWQDLLSGEPVLPDK